MKTTSDAFDDDDLPQDASQADGAFDYGPKEDRAGNSDAASELGGDQEAETKDDRACDKPSNEAPPRLQQLMLSFVDQGGTE